MEDFVAAVKVFCQDQNWKGFSDYINDSSSLVSKNASKIDSAIAAFDPTDHTLGYLALMVCKLSFPNLGDFELFVSQIKQLIELGCPNQISRGIDKFSYICHYFVKVLVEQKQAFRGISLICKAIQKIQKCPSELTSLHADLMQLCLVAKCMKPGIKFLDIGITTISAEMNKDAKSFLLYYYYGGMVYLAVKEFEKALFFFQVAVTTPSMVLSQIMLEAYKKYILLSVLLTGKVDALPKYTSAVVARYLKPLSTAYTELAETYNKYDSDELRIVANEHQQTFQNDNNVGIVKQVIASLIKKRIQKLTKTFLTLSLDDMATRVKLRDAEEAEKYLLEMIEDGIIFATIDQQAGMVSFHNNPDRHNTNTVLEKIHGKMEKCIALNEQLIQMDGELQVNPQYIQRVMNMAHLDDAGRVEEIMID